jgi:hypothetical protein
MILQRLCLSIVFTLFFQTGFSQFKHDYIWTLGYNSQSGHPLHGNPILDFNNNNLNISKEYLPIEYFLTNITMSNGDGDLIFSSNGCFITNSTYEIMENGDNLNLDGMGFYDNACPDGYTVSKGIITIPFPNHSGQYLLIHQSGTFSNTPPFTFVNKLLFSEIEMNMNLGKGSVIDKNQVIIEDTLHAGDLNAVKHSNNIDWWIITPKRSSNKYFKIIIDSNGISEILEQSIGIPTSENTTASGQLIFSSDGTKLARFNKTDQVYLYDFDRGTGELSNFQQLITTDSTISVGGVAFSSNNRFLYVSAQFNIYQFDLWASDIQASKVEVGTFDNFFEFDVSPVTFFLMQMGPDCRIYIIPPNSSQYIHVIHNPDEKGEACNFEQRAIKLPALNNVTLPNFPNYRLGTSFPVCDSNIVITASPMIFHAEEVVKIYPNPVSDILRVELFEPFQKEGEMILYNQTGQAVRFFELGSGESEFQFSVSELVSGMYFYRISESGTLRKSGKIIVQK